jgi:hypothetical protein
MKTPLITLPILGFLSTPTVATFIVGTWTHYKEKQMDEIIAHGTFIRTGTNHSNILNEGFGFD